MRKSFFVELYGAITITLLMDGVSQVCENCCEPRAIANGSIDFDTCGKFRFCFRIVPGTKGEHTKRAQSVCLAALITPLVVERQALFEHAAGTVVIGLQRGDRPE